MANPRPQLSNLKPFEPMGERAMGKVIGTRYPVEVEAVLNAMEDKQGFIRSAVENELRDRGLL